MHMFITGFANIWLLPGGRTNLSRPCFFKYLKGREHFPPYRFGLISALRFFDACSIKYLLLHLSRIIHLDAPGGWKKGIRSPVTRENFLIEFRYLAKFFGNTLLSPSSCSFRTETRYFAHSGKTPLAMVLGRLNGRRCSNLL